MQFLERDLEDIIFESDRKSLSDRGLRMYGKKLRQVRIGNYGIADLITINRYKQNDIYFDDYDKNGNPMYKDDYLPILKISVYELKKDSIGIETFLQAVRYVKGIQRYLKSRSFSFEVIFNIVLIGKSLNQSTSFSYFPEVINSDDFNLELYTYDYRIDGLHFESHSGFKLINEGF